MLKADQIPEAVWRVAMMTYHREIRRNPEQAWQLAVAAAITTWPGVKLENLCGWVMDGPDLPYVEETASIILPLQEPRT